MSPCHMRKQVDAASLALIENDKNALKNINFISEYAERAIEGNLDS